MPREIDNKKLHKAVKTVLIEARNNYVVWGRMLQGTSGVNELTASDLQSIFKLVKQYIVEEVK